MFRLIVDDFTEIRLLEENHKKDLFDLTDENREYLKKWLPWLNNNKTVDNSEDFIKNSLKSYHSAKGLVAGIWFDKKLAGIIGFNDIDWVNRKATIGYWLGASYQGNGLMTKSCRVLIDYAFNNMKMERVEIHCATGNAKSRAIPERLGFKEMGIVQYAEWLYDHFVDHVIYAMQVRDWHKLDDINVL